MTNIENENNFYIFNKIFRYPINIKYSNFLEKVMEKNFNFNTQDFSRHSFTTLDLQCLSFTSPLAPLSLEDNISL